MNKANPNSSYYNTTAPKRQYGDYYNSDAPSTQSSLSKRGPGGHHPTTAAAPSRYSYQGASSYGKENQPVTAGHKQPMPTDEKSTEQFHRKTIKCNTLTICATTDPIFYLRLIRHHFKKVSAETDRVLSLQSLGLSCQNLVFVACLVTMKGYATYKRIKNDHLSVPMEEKETGRYLGLTKKVRLTVKLHRADNFDEIIAMEEEAERQAKASRALSAPTLSAAANRPPSTEVQTAASTDTSQPTPFAESSNSCATPPDLSAISSELFDDLIQRAGGEQGFDMQRYLQQDEDDIANLLRAGADFNQEDPNFRVDEADLMFDDEDEDEEEEGEIDFSEMGIQGGTSAYQQAQF